MLSAVVTVCDEDTIPLKDSFVAIPGCMDRHVQSDGLSNNAAKTAEK